MSDTLLVKHITPEKGVDEGWYPPVKPALNGDAGLDLHYAGEKTVRLEKGRAVTLPCGIAVKIPVDHFGLIKARSSTFMKHGLFVVDGVIDSGYTGELFINVWHPGLVNFSDTVEILPRQRLAQLIIIPFKGCNIVFTNSLPATARGSNGFGSTGV